jgi:hypothetical protein
MTLRCNKFSKANSFGARTLDALDTELAAANASNVSGIAVEPTYAEMLDDPKYRAYSPRRPELSPRPQLSPKSFPPNAGTVHNVQRMAQVAAPRASPERPAVVSIAAATSILAWPADGPPSPPIEESRVVLLVRCMP